MNEIGILPNFRGRLIYDHWKPYYTYQDCQHGLCNAHHIRELQWVIDNHSQYSWAKSMQDLLLEIDGAVNKIEKNCFDDNTAALYRMHYRNIIRTGEIEMPLPPPKANPIKKRGREKKPKERNLLERLRDFEIDVLRFMSDPDVPFTNNRGENDIGMTKGNYSPPYKDWHKRSDFSQVWCKKMAKKAQHIFICEHFKGIFSAKIGKICPFANYAEWLRQKLNRKYLAALSLSMALKYFVEFEVICLLLKNMA